MRWRPADGRDGTPLRAAGRIGLIYVGLAGLWITLSDRALGLLVTDPVRLTLLQTWKGWGFVLCSGVLLVALVLRELHETRRSEERFRSLVEQTLIGVWVLRAGRFVYVNPRLAQIFGYEAETMTGGLGVEDILAPEDRDAVREQLRRTEAGETGPLRCSCRGRIRAGAQVRVEIFGRRIELEGAPAVIGVLLDRTDEIRLEEQLHRAERMEAIGQLTGSVAHDFNNLLTAIIAPLDLCLREMPSEARFRPELGEVRETAERAAALTRQLLAFSRKQLDRPRVLDPGEALRRLEPMLGRLIPDRIAFRVEGCELAHNVRMDPASLEQVVVNLVVNARDAIEQKGEIVVSVREITPESGELRRRDGADPGTHVSIEVRDTGHGIDEATRLRIFEPFFTTKVGGTGLGLATVFGRVKKAGGFVRVQSVPGEGTVFRVLLPGVQEPAEPTAARPRGSRGLTGKEHVLLVEDDPRVRSVTAAALERFGYSVTATDGAAEALRVAGDGHRPVELLVTDMNLSDGNGPELARYLSSLGTETRVLFMSGSSDEEVARALEGLEGALFLAKPFSLEALLSRVEEALAGPAVTVRSRRA